MRTTERREAWVEILDEPAARAHLQARHPYDFGFLPAMGRLIMAHPRIGSAFRGLFGEIMFQPAHLTRQEREMVAGVAAAAQDCHY